MAAAVLLLALEQSEASVLNREELSRSLLPEAGSHAYPFCVSELSLLLPSRGTLLGLSFLGTGHPKAPPGVLPVLRQHSPTCLHTKIKRKRNVC